VGPNSTQARRHPRHHPRAATSPCQPGRFAAASLSCRARGQSPRAISNLGAPSGGASRCSGRALISPRATSAYATPAPRPVRRRTAPAIPSTAPSCGLAGRDDVEAAARLWPTVAARYRRRLRRGDALTHPALGRTRRRRLRGRTRHLHDPANHPVRCRNLISGSRARWALLCAGSIAGRPRCPRWNIRRKILVRWTWGSLESASAWCR